MRTFESFHVQVNRIHGGKPILTPHADQAWENRTISDSACTFITNRDELAIVVSKLPFDENTLVGIRRQPALCIVIYAANGTASEEESHPRSSLGLAVFGPDLELLARHPEPVLISDQSYDLKGIEGGRLAKIGRRYVLTYTARSSDIPAGVCRIALASTTDFSTWIKHGVIRGNFNHTESTNGMIFEQKVGSRYMMLHQPLAGKDAATIHWAESTDIYREWKTRGLLMRPLSQTTFRQSSIHGAAPPIKLPDGRFLLLYQIKNRNADGSDKEGIGIALGDPGSRTFIVKRHEPLLWPEVPAAIAGDGNTDIISTLSVCGSYLYHDDLYILYTVAGRAVMAAKILKSEIAHFISR
jgi:beta-1,2-mannobiose phosphorylase / 1,2-beta-oligomannan phosphorylase